MMIYINIHKITNGGVVVDGERNVNAARWAFLFHPAPHASSDMSTRAVYGNVK
jgi:hypothetical protein